MRDLSAPKLNKWPFYIADVVLFGLAGFIIWQGSHPLEMFEIVAVAVCAALGALFSIWPFVLEYRATARLAETDALTSVIGQVQNIEIVAKRITEATGQWQTVNEYAQLTSTAAKEIADRMSVEAKEFAEFMKQANDSEKATLRLEVEKLRRAEGDWLQVLVHIFDHIFALHKGAVRSGQPRLLEHLSSFQGACLEAARRVGLTPFAAMPDEQFNAQRHETADGKTPPAGSVVAGTVAAGYTFQGKLIRLAVVELRGPAGTNLPETAPKVADQSQLPLPSDLLEE